MYSFSLHIRHPNTPENKLPSTVCLSMLLKKNDTTLNDTAFLSGSNSCLILEYIYFSVAHLLPTEGLKMHTCTRIFCKL